MTFDPEADVLGIFDLKVGVLRIFDPEVDGLRIFDLEAGVLRIFDPDVDGLRICDQEVGVLRILDLEASCTDFRAERSTGSKSCYASDGLGLSILLSSHIGFLADHWQCLSMPALINTSAFHCQR